VLVALMAEKAEVKYDPAYIMPSQIANHLTAIGYEATVLDDEVHGQNTVEVHVSVVSFCSLCEKICHLQQTDNVNQIHNIVHFAVCM